MNNQVRKIIKSSLLPKQKWTKDEQASYCFKCNKKFHSLIRRKHHCRYCGQVFCSQCSDLFLNGNDLGWGQKQIRMCEICYHICWKYIMKHDEIYAGEFRKSSDGSIPEEQFVKSQGFTIQQKIEQIKNLITDYDSKDLASIQKLNIEMSRKFKVLLQVVMKQKQISLQYLPKIYLACIQINSAMPAQSLAHGSMNISRHLQIKCVKGSEDLNIKFQKGILIRKKIISKKLKSNYENVNCVLVYGGMQSKDILGQSATFQNIVQFRLLQINKIVEYCKRISIDIIFLEGSIEKQFEDVLVHNDIYVINKVKSSTLQRIKSALHIQKIVEKISKLPISLKEQIVGYTDSIQSVSKIKFVNEEKEQSKSYFLISSRKASSGVTIYIQGKNGKLLHLIKKQLTILLQILRHMSLKIHKVKLDMLLLDSMTQNNKIHTLLHNSQMFFTLGSLSIFCVSSYLKDKYLTYKKISFCEDSFSFLSKQQIEQYIQQRIHSFEPKWDYLTKICGQIQDCHKIFYSQQDTPIGVYLMNKFASVSKKCKKCNKPCYSHIDMYYSTDQYLKVWSESIIIQDKQQFKSFVENQFDFALEIVIDDISKTKVKSKIQCFIECLSCEEKISKKIAVTREHLQYSTLAFCSHLLKGSTETFLIPKNTAKKYKQHKYNSFCQHTKKVRVFELADKRVKFYIGKYSIHRTHCLTEQVIKSTIATKQLNYSIQQNTLHINKIDRIVTAIIDQIKELINNSQFQQIVKNPRQSLIMNKKLVLKNQKLSHQQFISILAPSLIDQLKNISNLAKALFNKNNNKNYIEIVKTYHSLVMILKKIFMIVKQVKKSDKKKKYDKIFTIDEIEDNFVEEEISITNSQSLKQPSQISEQQNSKSYHLLTQDKSKFFPSTIYQSINFDALDSSEQQNSSKHKRKFSNMFSKTQNLNKTTIDQIQRHLKRLSLSVKYSPSCLEYFPCYTHRIQSIISTVLNSQQYGQAINSKQSINSLKFSFDEIQQDYQFINNNNEEFDRIKTAIINHEKIINDDLQEKKHKIILPTIHCQVDVLYPKEFNCLLKKQNISLKTLIESILGTENQMIQQGRQGPPILRSYNDLIVLKKVTAKQFGVLKLICPQYFTQIQKGSLLNKIFFAISITKKQVTQYYIVIENLLFGMSNFQIYDLNGDVNHRFSKHPKIPQDSNLIIDKNSEPLFCKENILGKLSMSVEFLCKYKLIDYSLLLIIEANPKDYYLDGFKIKISITNFLHEYVKIENLQILWKSAQNQLPDPNSYKNRMINKMRQFFVRIPL